MTLGTGYPLGALRFIALARVPLTYRSGYFSGRFNSAVNDRPRQ